VVRRYEQDGIRLLRTDRDGAVTAIAEGRTVLVSTYVSEQPAPAQFSSSRASIW
jgi:beta-lactamase superfamily II metal-dependent hydrolase